MRLKYLFKNDDFISTIAIELLFHTLILEFILVIQTNPNI